METSLIRIAECIPSLVKNTNLTVSLQGWPAAVAAVGLFGSCAIIYAIWANHSEAVYVGEGYCTT